MIADLHRQGRGVRAIAAELGRSPATISRELRGNRDPGSGQYRPFTAQRLAAGRRARPGRGKLVRDVVLRQFVQERLDQRWSPEQISHTLRAEFPDDPGRRVVPETIYQAIYRPELAGLCRDLPRVLRTGRRRRKPRRRPDARRPGSLVDMTMIDQRPAEAIDRVVPGHWEGDLITGAANRSAIGTLVERTSRYVILLHLPSGRHTAEAVRDALVAAMAHLPCRCAVHWRGTRARRWPCTARLPSPWACRCFSATRPVRGSGPATKTPTGCCASTSDLHVHSAEQLAAVAAELNDRPRKTLGWDTPTVRLGASLPPDTDHN